MIARPKGLSEGISALIGGAAAVGLGVVSLSQAEQVLAGTLNILGFFLGMMAMTAVAEQAGFFAWAANQSARLGRDSPARLFAAVFGIGALITVVFSNDATVLALTPLVLVLAERLRLPPLPYALACAFVANAASTLVPMANPLNIIVLTSFPRPLAEFVRYLGLPTVVAVLVSGVVLWWACKRELNGELGRGNWELGEGDAAWLRLTMVELAAIAAAYLVAAAFSKPLAYVALAGAMVLVGSSLALNRLDLRQMGRSIAWPIFPFIGGMFVVIQGLENGGWTRPLASATLHLTQAGPVAAAVGSGALTGLAANVLNNLPMAVVMISAMHQVPGPPASLLYGTLLGADLGPSLSVTGSLATMLWLIILRRRGVHISAWRYLRFGALVAPPMVLASALVLAAELALAR